MIIWRENVWNWQVSTQCKTLHQHPIYRQQQQHQQQQIQRCKQQQPRQRIKQQQQQQQQQQHRIKQRQLNQCGYIWILKKLNKDHFHFHK